MPSALSPRLLLSLLLVQVLVALAACSSSSREPDPTAHLAQGRPTTPAQSSTARSTSADLRPAVVVNGKAIPWEAVWEPMAEFSGGTIVAEIALDSLLQDEMARRSIVIGSEDVERERAALTRTISQGVGVSDASAQQLVRRVTVARGLGARRMDSLLRRNAMLRVLARENVTLTEDILSRAYDIDHGRRYVTRIITVPDNRQAADLHSSIQSGPPDSIRSRFAEAAVTHSSDPSGASGGLLGPLSPADTTLPAALRSSLASTPAGSLTPVLALDGSFAVALIESVIEPTGVPFESVRPTLEVAVRERLERLQMDVIASELLNSARVSVFDRSLDWGWQNRENR